jgi:hypothetical protein
LVALSFAAPERLLLLLLVAALFLLARPPRVTRSVSSAHLARWRAACERLRRPRQTPRRLRFWLLVAALVLAALAAAGPRLAVRDGPRVLVALLDASPSMAAREAEGSAYEQALAALRAAARALPAQVELRVATLGETPRVLRGSREELLAALPATPLPRVGRGPGPVELARELAAEPDLAVWTLSDARDGPLPDTGALSVFGGEPANRGIVAVELREAWPLVAFELVVEVSGELQGPLEVQGAAVERAPQDRVELGPGRTRVTLFLARRAGEDCRIALPSADDDALALDDAVALRVAAPVAGRIGLMGATTDDGASLALRSARLLAELAGAELVAVSGGERVDLLVVDGGQLAAAPPRSLSFGTAFAELPPRLAPRLADWDRSHPLSAGLDLSELTVRQALAGAALPADGMVLIAAADGPLAVAREQDGQRSVHFAFRLEDSNLPLLAALPQLLRRSLAWVGGEGSRSRVLDAGPLDAAESELRRSSRPPDRRLPDFGAEGLALTVPLLLLAAALLTWRCWC